jgi:hypothetical protein
VEGVLNIVFAFLDERNIFETGAGWSARPSVVTWNLGGRTPENTSGFLHAEKEGKMGGFGSLMGSVSVPFAPGQHGILGGAGGRGSKGEARSDIWSKDTSAARISGAFGGLVGSVGNGASVDGYTCRTGEQQAAGEDENQVLRRKLAALEEMKEQDAREIADLKKKLAAKAPQGMSSVFGGMVGSVATGAGGFLGSMTKGAGLVTGMNPHVSGSPIFPQNENQGMMLIPVYLPSKTLSLLMEVLT